MKATLVRVTAFCAFFLTIPLATGSFVKSSAQAATTQTTLAVSQIKGANYYPAHHSWTRMWTDPQAAVLADADVDFGHMQAAGLNTVRIIIPAGTFGYPTLKPSMTGRLAAFVSLAQSHSLHVMLTVFDWFNNWSDVTGSAQWATALLSPYKNNPEIVAVEKNEIAPWDPAQMTWFKTIIGVERSALGNIPVTASVIWSNPTMSSPVLAEKYFVPAGWTSAAAAAARPDFYDIHFYGNPADAATVFSRASTDVAGVPLIVGETGVSSTFNAGTEDTQASYLTTVLASAKTSNLPVLVWAFVDFATDGFPSIITNPAASQGYGLLRSDGTPKPAYSVVFPASGNASNVSTITTTVPSTTTTTAPAGRAVTVHKVTHIWPRPW